MRVALRPLLLSTPFLAGLLLGPDLAPPLRAAPPAEPALEPYAALRADDPEVRLRAASELAPSPTRGPLEALAPAIPFLVIALEDEAAPVRAAAAERLLALAQEAADPLLDALEQARPGARSGTFGALMALGARVTPSDLAFASGGGPSPVQEADRREAALFLSLPKVTDLDEPHGGPRWALLRLGEALLRDPSPLVRRTAAGSLALVAGRTAAGARGPAAPRRLVRVEEPLRTRLVNLIRAGTDARTYAACELAGRFGDGHESIRAALLQALGQRDVRDAAALALADLGANDPATLAALGKAGGYGAWRALLRAGADAEVREALAGRDLQRRRLAIAVATAEERLLEEAAAAARAGLEEKLDDGEAADVLEAVAQMRTFGSAARAFLPLLEAHVAREDVAAPGRDLAAAFALALDATLPWAQARIDPWTAPPGVVPLRPAPGEDPASLVAAALEADRVRPDAPPAALAQLGPAPLTLWQRPLGVHVARWLARHPTAEGPYVQSLSGLLVEQGPDPARSSLAPPGLRSWVALGASADVPFAVRRAFLDALARTRVASPATRASLAALLGAPDPWLRHLAARALRALPPG